MTNGLGADIGAAIDRDDAIGKTLPPDFERPQHQFDIGAGKAAIPKHIDANTVFALRAGSLMIRLLWYDHTRDRGVTPVHSAVIAGTSSN